MEVKERPPVEICLQKVRQQAIGRVPPEDGARCALARAKSGLKRTAHEQFILNHIVLNLQLLFYHWMYQNIAVFRKFYRYLLNHLNFVTLL